MQKIFYQLIIYLTASAFYQAPGGVQEYSGGAHAFFFRPPAMYGIAKQTGIR